MKSFVFCLLAVLLATCGPQPRKADNRSPEQRTADAIGISTAELANRKSAIRPEIQALDDSALRQATRAGCGHLRGKAGYSECVVRQRTAAEEAGVRLDRLVASDPTTACVETKTTMGLSKARAEQTCQAFSPQCRAEYAKRFWRHADSVTFGLLGAEGKGYFKCQAADETEFAGEVIRNATFPVLFSGRTLMSSDPCHGEQVEYYAPDGKAYLWYGDNANIVQGEWEIVTDSSDPRFIHGGKVQGKGRQPPYCQRYGANTYNPATKKRGGGWECLPVFLIVKNKVRSADGDVFGLSQSQSVPHSLRDRLPELFRDFANPYPGGVCKEGRVVRG